MKYQVPSTKLQTNSKSQAPNVKQYDLEDRTMRFALECREFIRRLPRTISNLEDAKQLARASGSPAANYIEANESLSKKDFIHRVKICRKEAKESRLWLRCCFVGDDVELEQYRQRLVQEATELLKIFSAIVEKST